MRPIQIGSMLTLITSLLGCQFQSEASQAEIVAAGRCNASAVSHLIGEPANPAVLDQARTQSGAESARIVRPGEMITQEYNERRLTLSTDEKLKIQRIRCG